MAVLAFAQKDMAVLAFAWPRSSLAPNRQGEDNLKTSRRGDKAQKDMAVPTYSGRRKGDCSAVPFNKD
ncbi:hypothetical protein AYI92_01415 [Shewanella xiamenensis]|nr:hypothetical protein AYI90_02615 [Shewanella xiamenensis]TVL24022.1 hypothetical protein AYI91_03160 [Shewanella xiamenensis]TVL29072.1 hypothetical protein AYI92_01415 [Shewanella xiamenensis]TVL37161.1 hypothetical protein AYI93_02850 [Shewanella xiamenensis]TVP04955.1 hypothetical protein AYI89_03385 [Shewanella xiamenensis]